MQKGVSGIRWLWPVATGAAMGAGAAIALQLFPQAGFARNPTGQYGPHLAGFALSVAAPTAITQCILLVIFVNTALAQRLIWTMVWLLVTAAGIVAIIMPLWWWDAVVFTVAPWLVILPTLPGAVLLGYLQWIAGFRLFGARYFWITLTITGAVIGAVGGLIIAFVLQPLPLEVTWATTTGAAIGFPQGWLLQQAFGDSDHGRPAPGGN